MTDHIRSYEPDNSLKNGYLPIFREIFEEIAANRYLIYQLVRRDLFTLYKQSFIGVFWAVLLPLISVGMFIALNQSGIFSTGSIQVPYAIFAILGLTFWQIFATGLIAATNALVKAGGMITKIKLSLKSLVIASMGQALIAFGIQLVLLIALFVYYGFAPHLAILLIPVLAIPVLFLTLGLGLILSILNGIMRDISNIVSVLMTVLMFMTPIFYLKPSGGVLAGLTRYNPMYYLVAGPRELILWGTMTEWKGYLIACAVSVAVFLVCLVTFHITEARVAERV